MRQAISTYSYWLRALGALAVAAVLAGCAAKGGSTALEGAAADEAVPAYIIGPGDSVNVFVWGNPDLSANVPVRPDGKITTPLVEDVQASGKTPTELAREMENRLGTYIKNPVVTVIVTSFVGRFSEQVRVVGQAAQPQSLPYRENLSLLDVMISVGGLTEFASGNSASLVRTEDGKQRQYRLRIDDLLNDGDISANVALRPGDIVIIPEAWF